MSDNDFESLSNERLIKMTKESQSSPDNAKATIELYRRKIKRENEQLRELKKPHWSLTPSFIVLLLTMLFAAIAAWPVIREWFQSSPHAHINSSSHLLQSSSKITTQGEQQRK
jgi:hypothetical protein